MVVVVTGLSGAGKSQALHGLEDLGFFCVDNLPTVLAPQAVALCERGGMTRLALGIDVRVRAFLGEVGHVLQMLEAGGHRDLQVLFFDASDETLLRRFSETRRPHPLSAQGVQAEGGAGPGDALAVLDGVRVERERLAPLRAAATRVIDTTDMSVHELRRVLVAHFGPASGGAPRMVTRVVSFGFKYGTPVDADLVLDVRFLRNPHFVPELKPLTGLDAPVARFVLEDPETREFLQRTRSLLEYVMPKFEREGKSYVTIAIGCTGGRHRSVAIADALGRELAAPRGARMAVLHRDIQRGTVAPAGDHPPSSAGAADAGDGPSESQEERANALELKGATAPPPATGAAAREPRDGREAREARQPGEPFEGGRP
ncbi:MAG: RNase adapter RapZ [Myxococcales bacterium]|nr:RNase adapter RapZ [Myxococcales bacterium]